MALIKCKECGHMISDKASECPNCGCPTENAGTYKEKWLEDNPKKNRWWVWAFIAVLLCLIGASIYYALNNSSEKGDEAVVKDKAIEFKDSVSVAEKVVVNKKEEENNIISAGLSLNTFTKKRKENGKSIQSSLGNEVIAANLRKLGFKLVNKVKETRLDYTGEEHYDVTIETYSKTVNGRVTTVKLDEDFSDIHFPGLDDVDEFKKTVRAGGLRETKDGFEDNEDIYYDGTNVSVKGTNVILQYKWEP